MKPPAVRPLPLLLAAALTLTGCASNSRTSAEPTPAGASPTVQQTASDIASTAVGTPAIPAGWTTYREPRSSVSLAAPAEWSDQEAMEKTLLKTHSPADVKRILAPFRPSKFLILGDVRRFDGIVPPFVNASCSQDPGASADDLANALTKRLKDSGATKLQGGRYTIAGHEGVRYSYVLSGPVDFDVLSYAVLLPSRMICKVQFQAVQGTPLPADADKIADTVRPL